MNLSALVSLLRTMLYGGLVALIRLFKLICRPRQRPKRPEHRPTQTGCVRVDHPAVVRPDPLIYSQRHLMAQGLAVTWDNPDIELFKGGVPANSGELEPNTTYEVRARIWNNSLEAPVIHMPVRLAFLDFGIGTEPIPIGSTFIDVGVKGSVDQPRFASIPWTTPPTPGHYCLQVLLDPVVDLESANNLGQENTNVVAAHSPAVFQFTLRNETRRARQYRFELDAYVIPQLPRCEIVMPAGDKRVEEHRRGRHPVPPGFSVQIVPQTPTLDADESIQIIVSVEPPAGFVGRQNINVNAFHELGFAGGVTLTCVKEA